MSILETDVMLTLSGISVKHFEELGYKIPRYIDSQGRSSIKRGTKILVKVSDLQRNSESKLTKVCDDCGKHSKNQSYKTILKNRHVDGKDRCSTCGKKFKWKLQDVPYEKTLEYYAKENNKEYLLIEYSFKNTKRTNEIYKSSSEVFWWNCPDCKSEYDMSVNHRNNGRNCPYCSGDRVNHTNCLWSSHPEIAELLKDQQRGYELTHGSHKKEIFSCPCCGKTNLKTIAEVTTFGFSCRNCSDGISYPEKFMMNFLEQLGLDFKTQKIFDWSKGLYHLNPKYKQLSGSKKYDFYIQSLNLIIETHGQQHYEEGFNVCGGRNQDEENENDDLKYFIAINNGVVKYISIDCRKSELEWIKNNILESQLNEIFDLTKINWIKCHEFACKTIIKTACDLWNSGIENLTEIGNILNLSRTTINNYLKKGKAIGWCSYEPKKFNGTKKGKSIVQLTEDGCFIKEWESMAEVYKELNITVTSISAVCRGKRKTASGFKWEFKENN